MRGITRRQLLTGTGVGLTGVVAGCTSSDDDDESEDDESTEESETESETDDEGSILGDIVVDNSSDSSHTVDVIVEFDRETESWVSESLEGNDSVTLEREWPNDPGSIRVTARLDEGEPMETTPEQWNEPDCLDLFVRIDDDEVTFLSDTNNDTCGEDPADIDDAEEE